ncbi:hypothetical protein Clacol_008667 [Clathrus columnatus]|uniref:Uncharacterized protein n=1 Tax=Clathrus columnatus TaxID=1419009 RepID=A0AAV5ALP7_9AGAM|nr:hypothetical protein Clacol_008667 [Clathrus columnatus]
MSSPAPKALHYLGIDLTQDGIRAVVVDDALDVVVADSVMFDVAPSTSPSPHSPPFDPQSQPTPSSPSLKLSSILASLDTLLFKLSTRTNLALVRSISGSAFSGVVFYNSGYQSILRALNGTGSSTNAKALFQDPSSILAIPTTPTPAQTDTPSSPFASLLESYFGGPVKMSQKTGTAAFSGHISGLVGAQMMLVRATMPDVWRSVGGVSGLGGLIGAVLTAGGGAAAVQSGSGSGLSIELGEALMWGLMDVDKGTWDVDAVRFVAGEEGGQPEYQRVLGMLGQVNDKTTVQPFTSTHLATYLSLVPTTSDSVLSFGAQDAMIFSSPSPPSTPSRHNLLAQILPHPAQDPSEPRRWVSVLTARNGDTPRTLVRDLYTKSWSAFDRLVSIVPPGGSIGLDDKLFSFWFLLPEYESCYVGSKAATTTTKPPRGIFRFENGTKVTEFRDLRANPRCLVEGQIMAFRTRYGRVVAASNNGNNVPNGISSPNGPTSNGHTNGHPSHRNTFSSTSTSPSLSFDPYNSNPLPRRIFATGTASYFPSIVNVVGEVFNCPVFVPQSVMEEGVVWASVVTELANGGAGAGAGGDGSSEKEKEESSTPNSGADVTIALANALATIPSRAAIGSAYIARWSWKRASGSNFNGGTFEDDVRWLLAKRWAQQQHQLQQQQAGGTTPSSTYGGFGFGLSSPSPNTPSGHSSSGLGFSGLGVGYGHRPGGLHRAKSNLALASEIVVEEDEEGEEDDGEGESGQLGSGSGGGVEQPRDSSVYKYPPPGSVNITHTSSSSSSSTLTVPTPIQPHIFPQPSQQQQQQQQQPLTLTTTSLSATLHANPGPLTSLIGPLPTPAPVTSTLHPITALTTNDSDAQFGLVKVAEPDEDAFVCYASMVFEWGRLESGVWGGMWG